MDSKNVLLDKMILRLEEKAYLLIKETETTPHMKEYNERKLESIFKNIENAESMKGE